MTHAASDLSLRINMQAILALRNLLVLECVLDHQEFVRSGAAIKINFALVSILLLMKYEACSTKCLTC